MEPNGWKHSKLPDFAWFQEGPGLRKWQFTDSGCKVINITNIVNGVLDLNKTDRFISYEELNAKYKHFLCDPGDIVIASSGNSYCKHGIIREQDLPLVMNTSVIRFKPLDNCDYEFLNQFLKSKYLKQQIDILITGGAQPNFGPAHLKEVVLSLPPLPEQQKIAKILSTWDQAIATTERLIAASQQQKKPLMQQLLTGKKRLVNPETGKVFEGDWAFASFNEIFKVANNKSTQVQASDYLEIGKFPIVDQGKALIGGFTNNKEIYKDLPVIIFGDHTRAVKWVDFEFAPGADGTQVLKSLSHIDTKFSYYLLLHTDIPNLGYSRHMRELKEKDFKYPVDIIEQQKIASVLTTADQEIELLEAKLAHLKDEKKALMQQLLTGKRRVIVSEMD